MLGMPGVQKIGEFFGRKGSKGPEEPEGREAGPTKQEKLDQLRSFVNRRNGEQYGRSAVGAPRKPYYPKGLTDVQFLEALREVGVGQPQELIKIFDTMIENARQSDDPDLQGDIEEMEKLRGYLDDFDKKDGQYF